MANQSLNESLYDYMTLQDVYGKDKFSYIAGQDQIEYWVQAQLMFDDEASTSVEKEFFPHQTKLSSKIDGISHKLKAKFKPHVSAIKMGELARVNDSLQYKALYWAVLQSGDGYSVHTRSREHIQAGSFITKLGGKVHNESLAEVQASRYLKAVLPIEEVAQLYDSIHQTKVKGSRTIKGVPINVEEYEYSQDVVCTVHTIYKTQTKGSSEAVSLGSIGSGSGSATVSSVPRRFTRRQAEKEQQKKTTKADAEEATKEVTQKDPIAGNTINNCCFIKYATSNTLANCRIRIAKDDFKRTNKNETNLVVYLIATRDITVDEELLLERCWEVSKEDRLERYNKDLSDTQPPNPPAKKLKPTVVPSSQKTAPLMESIKPSTSDALKGHLLKREEEKKSKKAVPMTTSSSDDTSSSDKYPPEDHYDQPPVMSSTPSKNVRPGTAPTNPIRQIIKVNIQKLRPVTSLDASGLVDNENSLPTSSPRKNLPVPVPQKTASPVETVKPTTSTAIKVDQLKREEEKKTKKKVPVTTSSSDDTGSSDKYSPVMNSPEDRHDQVHAASTPSPAKLPPIYSNIMSSTPAKKTRPSTAPNNISPIIKVNIKKRRPSTSLNASELVDSENSFATPSPRKSPPIPVSPPIKACEKLRVGNVRRRLLGSFSSRSTPNPLISRQLGDLVLSRITNVESTPVGQISISHMNIIPLQKELVSKTLAKHGLKQNAYHKPPSGKPETYEKVALVVYQGNLPAPIDEIIHKLLAAGNQVWDLAPLKMNIHLENQRRFMASDEQMEQEAKKLGDFTKDFYGCNEVRIQFDKTTAGLFVWLLELRARMQKKINVGLIGGVHLVVIFFPMVILDENFMLKGDKGFTNLGDLLNQSLGNWNNFAQIIFPKVILCSSTGCNIPRPISSKLNIIKLSPVPLFNPVYSAKQCVNMGSDFSKQLGNVSASGSVNILEAMKRTILFQTTGQMVMSNCDNSGNPSIYLCGKAENLKIKVDARGILNSSDMADSDIRGVGHEFKFHGHLFMKENASILTKIANGIFRILKCEKTTLPCSPTRETQMANIVRGIAEMANSRRLRMIVLVFSTQGSSCGSRFYMGSNFMDYGFISYVISNHAPDVERLVIVQNHGQGLIENSTVIIPANNRHQLSYMPRRKIALDICVWTIIRLSESRDMLGLFSESKDNSVMKANKCPLSFLTTELMKLKQSFPSQTAYNTLDEVFVEYKMFRTAMIRGTYVQMFPLFIINLHSLELDRPYQWADKDENLRNLPSIETSIDNGVRVEEMSSSDEDENAADDGMVENIKSSSSEGVRRETKKKTEKKQDEHKVKTPVMANQVQMPTSRTDGIPGLNQEMANEIYRIMKNNSLNTIVGDGDLDIRSVKTLDDDNQLNDIVMNAYSKLIMKKRLDMTGKDDIFLVDTSIGVALPKQASPVDTNFHLKWFKKLNTKVHKMIIIPVPYTPDGKKFDHWLVNLLNLDTMELICYDSLGFRNQSIQQKLETVLTRALATHPNFGLLRGETLRAVYPADAPKQNENTNDCGVMALQFLKYKLLFNMEMPKELPMHAQRIRSFMQYELLLGSCFLS